MELSTELDQRHGIVYGIEWLNTGTEIVKRLRPGSTHLLENDMRQRDKDKKIVFEEELIKLEKEFENAQSYPWHLIEAMRYLKAELKKLEGE